MMDRGTRGEETLEAQGTRELDRSKLGLLKAKMGSTRRMAPIAMSTGTDGAVTVVTSVTDASLAKNSAGPVLPVAQVQVAHDNAGTYSRSAAASFKASFQDCTSMPSSASILYRQPLSAIPDGQVHVARSSRPPAQTSLALARTQQSSSQQSSSREDDGKYDDDKRLKEKPSGARIQDRSTVKVVKWTCSDCANECIPVRRESRCLCGHRLKEHAQRSADSEKFPCASKGCACRHFFFVVAEGSWILRCRCKHKHIEHDCADSPFKCNKCRGGCTGFDSPWVCNCGHMWNRHAQSVATMSNTASFGPEHASMQDFCAPVQPKRGGFAVRQDGLLAKELDL
jgi:Protein FAM221A/B